MRYTNRYINNLSLGTYMQELNIAYKDQTNAIALYACAAKSAYVEQIYICDIILILMPCGRLRALILKPCKGEKNGEVKGIFL